MKRADGARSKKQKAQQEVKEVACSFMKFYEMCVRANSTQQQHNTTHLTHSLTFAFRAASDRVCSDRVCSDGVCSDRVFHEMNLIVQNGFSGVR